MITANIIKDHILNKCDWVDKETTVDTIKIGDGDKPIEKVGVCWYSSIQTIQSSIDTGCDLLITHEPTWWDHFDKPGGWREKEPGLTKTKLLEKSGMVVLRLHDSWDRWPKIGIRDSFAKTLGLDNFILEGDDRWHAIYEVQEQTLKEFAGYVAEKIKPLGDDAVQVMGNPDMKVRYPSIGIGCCGPKDNMIEKGSDVLIMCFDGATYWRDRDRFAEYGVGVITLEHGSTEMSGMQAMTGYLKETWPELNVQYFDNHWKAWHMNNG